MITGGLVQEGISQRDEFSGLGFLGKAAKLFDQLLKHDMWFPLTPGRPHQTLMDEILPESWTERGS